MSIWTTQSELGVVFFFLWGGGHKGLAEFFFWEGGAEEGHKNGRMDPGGMGSKCDRDALYEIPK